MQMNHLATLVSQPHLWRLHTYKDFYKEITTGF
jgi:hypothetical protein